MMKIVAVNGSPAGKSSITLQTLHYILLAHPECECEIIHVGNNMKTMEARVEASREKLEEADLILFCYPVYTFLVPAQLHRFIECMKQAGLRLEGKVASQISTSKHFYDTTAQRFVEENCADMGMRCIRGLSADMEDLLKPEGQQDALAFFQYVQFCMEQECYDPVKCVIESWTPVMPSVARSDAVREKGARKIAIVADLPAEDKESAERLQRMVERFQQQIACEAEIVFLQEFPFAGGCLGCFHCSADGQCVYKDGFESMLRDRIQKSDATVYAFRIQDHSMGVRMKLFDDRQFCNGHRTVTMGKPVGYLVDGPLSQEENLRTLLEARAQVGGNFLAGIACTEQDPDGEVDALAKRLVFAMETHYTPPANFYGVGGMKIFRDLIYQMQGLMREDHRFYKAHGLYNDFPQKRKGTILGMYAVGAVMNSKTLRKKAGGRMTEGMLAPYRKVLEKAAEQRDQGK